jgi:hypothetical protein
VVWLDFEHGICWVEAVELDLGLNRVLGWGQHGHKARMCELVRSYIVTRERSPLKHNLVLLLRRLVESSHHKMQIDSQSVHNDNLLRRSSNNGSTLLRALRRHVLVRSQRRILELCEVASDGDRAPCLQIRSEVL